MSIIEQARALARPQTPAGRELALLVAALACGILVVPWLIWIVGRAVLGEYAHGGPFALWGNFFRGLATGGPAYWAVALGPYALALTGRALWRLLHRS